VLLCTDEMMNGTLNEAVNSTQPDLSQVKVTCQFTLFLGVLFHPGFIQSNTLQ
jgi:hypothetical protein